MIDYSKEIAALEKAISSGALEIRNDTGRLIRYDSFESLRARLRFLKEQQAGAAARPSSAGFATFDRGDR